MKADTICYYCISKCMMVCALVLESVTKSFDSNCMCHSLNKWQTFQREALFATPVHLKSSRDYLIPYCSEQAPTPAPTPAQVPQILKVLWFLRFSCTASDERFGNLTGTPQQLTSHQSWVHAGRQLTIQAPSFSIVAITHPQFLVLELQALAQDNTLTEFRPKSRE